MRVLLGVDMERLDRFIKPQDALIQRILSATEYPLYQALTSSKRKAEFLAGRFVSKEAYKKAYQTFKTPLNFTDVSILNRPDGSPYIVSKYRPNDTLQLSISHTDDSVIAVVTGETTD